MLNFYRNERNWLPPSPTNVDVMVLEGDIHLGAALVGFSIVPGQRPLILKRLRSSAVSLDIPMSGGKRVTHSMKIYLTLKGEPVSSARDRIDCECINVNELFLES